MRSVFLFLVPFTVSQMALALASADPLAGAAAYYFDHQDYHQALRLWSEVLRRDSASLDAARRVAHLKLMFEPAPGARAAARDILVKFLANNPDLGDEDRRAAQQAVASVATLFLTDDGQAGFYRGLAQRKLGDCGGALGLLNSANLVEPGHVRILTVKAYCERGLGMMQASSESLAQAFESNPFDPKVAERLSEMDLYFHNPQKVVARYRQNPELLTDLRARTAFGVALEATGELSEAVQRLQTLLVDGKTVNVPLIVYFALGRALATRVNTSTEATFFLERFVSGAARPENALVDGWDPYHIPERVAEAQKLLASLHGKARR